MNGTVGPENVREAATTLTPVASVVETLGVGLTTILQPRYKTILYDLWRGPGGRAGT